MWGDILEMKKILFHLLLLFSGSLLSQSYHMRTLTQEDDSLSDNTVNHLIQDRRGLIWMATDQGISQWNGIEFTQIIKTSKLPAKEVQCLYEDVKGHIWIGTAGGLSVFDGYNLRSFSEEDGLPSNAIKSIVEDGFGRLWIGTHQGGLCTLDNFSNEGTKFLNYELKYGSKKNLTINKVIETPDAKVYAGTDIGLFEIDNGSDKIYGRKEGIRGEVEDLIEDVNGDIWIGTDEGLYLKSNDNIKKFHITTGFPIRGVKSLAMDKADNIWIGTLINGVIKLNINTYDYKVFNNNNSNLCGNSVSAILEDANDNIWVAASDMGISKLTGISFSYLNEKSGLPNEKINDLIQDHKGNFWYATERGLIWSDQKDSIYIFNTSNGLPTNYVSNVFEDDEDNIWVGTIAGLVKIQDHEVVKSYGFMDGFSPVTNISQDDEGLVWVGTKGGGVAKIDGEEVKFLRMIDGLPNGDITAVTRDQSGKVWIGTRNTGIIWYNGIEFATITEEDGLLPSNKINTMIRGPRKEIFIGTRNGLTIYNESRNTYVTLSSKNSKLSSDNIKSLIVDEDNQLWIASNAGLDRISFNPPQVTRQTGELISEIKHFGKTHGVIGRKINTNAVYEDYEGNIWFGTTIGALKHDRTVDNTNDVAPQVFFTGLNLNGQKIDWAKRNFKVEPWSEMPTNLVLPYDSSTITFEFVGVNHDNTSNGTSYYWYLEGYEDANFIPRFENEIEYKKIPPGEYTFVVYACNGDEFCSDKTPAKFSFTISPPFWQEIWFITILIVVVIGSIILFIQSRERKLVAERELLEEKVKERTQEVVDKNKQLELVNLEMVAKNKEIEEKNNDLNSSIRYALTIQQASFPPVQDLKNMFPNSFIYHLPRDIVSGDFYWYRTVGNKFVIACADCTGHGVPGALTSMIGIALLNEIVGGNKITDPAIALTNLDKGILKAFENSESETNDGMDISLITIDPDLKTIEYAGAYRPLIMIRDNQLTEYKATKMSIGFKDVPNKDFEKTTIQYQEGDNFYMFSDGYPDQFGGERNKKFKTKTMKEMLVQTSAIDMASQKEIVNQRLKDWMGETEQVDDILVMGIKL